MLASQADTEAWYGRLKNARELTRQAIDSAEHNDAKETVAAYQAAAALREVESGNREQARADADAALKLTPNRDDKTFALDTLVQQYWLSTIRAAVALERKDPNRANELLKVASTIELGAQENLLPVRPGLARAYALDAATDPIARDKARAAYQDLLTLWKDADSDIPIYKQAKAEYAKLQ
jgi:eukaryotic-like serine/threonine-protein kinase